MKLRREVESPECKELERVTFRSPAVRVLESPTAFVGLVAVATLIVSWLL
jgi:hypothetical protein